jgi:hypothetical protein
MTKLIVFFLQKPSRCAIIIVQYVIPSVHNNFNIVI